MMLLHRFEQGGLGLGRRAVDLVGQHHVGEDRSLEEDETAPAGLGVVLEDVGAGDVGRHQVGRELDALERQVQDLDTVLTSRVLARPGTPTSRQWPRLNRAISSCSTTSFWPTITRPICSVMVWWAADRSRTMPDWRQKMSS